MIYETTGHGFVFDELYNRSTATYEEEAYQQMLTVFDDGLSTEDAKYCFTVPVGQAPLNKAQLETQVLFKYIVANFDSLIQQCWLVQNGKPHIFRGIWIMPTANQNRTVQDSKQS